MPDHGAFSYDLQANLKTLQADGIVGLKHAFPTEWADSMCEDMMSAFWSVIQRQGGAVGRGPRRWYVEIHPEEFGGFIDLVSHPWVMGMCEAALGQAYQIVELGFDVQFQGAKYQPWHRDFPSPRDTYIGRRITSLAFNLSGVDVTDEMGPFEVAVGTQWDDGRTWANEMFPQKALWPRYQARSVRDRPQRGDISCRSALTVHRGTAHLSPIARPMLMLGVDAPGAGHAQMHDMMVTRQYHDALPERLRKHLVCRVVDKLVPITQRHDIEGLAMGVDPA